jgi:transcriptional regulator with XRE-family HTH domain
VRLAPAGREPGAIVRSARQAEGLTLAELGRRTGYSAAQVSRFERGIAPLTDIAVLRPLVPAEAARNLAILARKAGWYAQAMSIALSAAGQPDLRNRDPERAAERGLLIQSAAYTAARSGDRTGMRELTSKAAAIATGLGGATLLRDHGGGFSTATVALHRISAEYSIGEPGAAIAAARQIPPASLPSVERRARYYTDVARAFGQWGRRNDCLSALLAAERQAPEETHARPAVRDLISGLLVSGRTAPELRGLAARCGIT